MKRRAGHGPRGTTISACPPALGPRQRSAPSLIQSQHGTGFLGCRLYSMQALRILLAPSHVLSVLSTRESSTVWAIHKTPGSNASPPRCQSFFTRSVKLKVGESLLVVFVVASGLGVELQLFTQKRTQRSSKRRMSGLSIGQMLPGTVPLLARFGFAKVK
jgi:hypothetical protein